jgi:hypothetical protein
VNMRCENQLGHAKRRELAICPMRSEAQAAFRYDGQVYGYSTETVGHSWLYLISIPRLDAKSNLPDDFGKGRVCSSKTSVRGSVPGLRTGHPSHGALRLIWLAWIKESE